MNALNLPCTPQQAGETRAAVEARCPAFGAANHDLTDASNELFQVEILNAQQTW